MCLSAASLGPCRPRPLHGVALPCSGRSCRGLRRRPLAGCAQSPAASRSPLPPFTARGLNRQQRPPQDPLQPTVLHLEPSATPLHRASALLLGSARPPAPHLKKARNLARPRSRAWRAGEGDQCGGTSNPGAHECSSPGKATPVIPNRLPLHKKPCMSPIHTPCQCVHPPRLLVFMGQAVSPQVPLLQVWQVPQCSGHPRQVVVLQAPEAGVGHAQAHAPMDKSGLPSSGSWGENPPAQSCEDVMPPFLPAFAASSPRPPGRRGAAACGTWPVRGAAPSGGSWTRPGE